MVSLKTVLALPALLVLVAMAPPVHPGSGLAGHWEGQLKGETKIWPFSFDFQVDGAKLTGTLEIPSLDQTVPVTKGTVSGNNFKFEAFGLWSGTIAGDTLVLTRELDGGKQQHTSAHRAARKAGS